MGRQVTVRGTYLHCLSEPVTQWDSIQIAT